jgi:hypothetical protein
MISNCVLCENAYCIAELDKNQRCPICRKDRRLIIGFIIVLIPLLVAWGIMMLLTYWK